MSRESSVRAHGRSLEVLDEAVLAMKSLSAHHFRVAREALLATRAYRVALERAVSGLGAHSIASMGAPPRLVVIGGDLGLCAQYHTRLVDASRESARALEISVVDCIGRRTASLLARAGVATRAVYAAPSSVESATRVLLEVVGDVFEDYGAGRIGDVHVLFAHFEGVGAFEPTRSRLLPLEPLAGAGPPASPYVNHNHLREVAIRERLFTVLEEHLLDAMASEHGMRLVATNAAGDWLDREIGRSRRLLRTLRQEAATQEILELVAGARRQREEPRAAPPMHRRR